MTLWEQYERKMFEISAYGLLLSTAFYDGDTIAPRKGEAYRNDRMSFIEGEAFSLQTAPEFVELLNKLAVSDELDVEKKKIINWQLKDLNRIINIPKDFFVEFSRTCMEANQVWKKAKETNDYALFKPYLMKLIEDKKQLLEYRNSDKKPYDVYLDDFEPGMDMESYDRFFNTVRKELVPLIRKISAADPIDDSFVYRHYPVEDQRKLMNRILKYMEFDMDAGVLGETEHPFTNSLSKYDNRITTHYYENNLMSSIYSVVHEAGHATYNYQVADRLAETYCFDNMSSGMHESQSRLMENYLARTREFWVNNFDYMKELFPEQLSGVSLDDFYLAANVSRCSLIRTEADELTYPLHIMVRYELEKGIFDGTVDLDRLDVLWADKYEEYLGVRPEKLSQGILQDVHWAGGSFGYFPTYALGSGYAAQFMHAMRRDIDPEECMRNNRFILIKDWLREHIHQYGGLNSPKEQIVIATGEPFDPKYYTDYLKDKYTKIYKL